MAGRFWPMGYSLPFPAIGYEEPFKMFEWKYHVIGCTIKERTLAAVWKIDPTRGKRDEMGKKDENWRSGEMLGFQRNPRNP